MLQRHARDHLPSSLPRDPCLQGDGNTLGSRALWGAMVFVLWIGACADPVDERESDVLVVSQETQAAWIRNFNPLLPPGTARWPTRAGIYEPLAIFNAMTAAYVPWLATEWAWEDAPGGAASAVHVTLRPGVEWSDGEPFLAEDVVFTFELLRDRPALDLQGVWAWLDAVEAVGDDAVVFRFARPFVPGLDDLLAQPIVPRHVWQDVRDPLAFANPDPVGTGPFTEVNVFENQVFELGRNPGYWQEGKPAVRALRFPAFAGNDQSNLALANGEVDWAGNFVPAADRTFVAADPEHRVFWSPPVEGTVFLYANTRRAPFGSLPVRKAISLALDRELMVKVAMYGTTRPADATALSDAYAGYRDAAVAASGDWVMLDPERAGRMLDEAGFPAGKDGVRVDAEGEPLRFTVLTVAGWSDWMRAAQVIARNLSAIGIDARVVTADFNAWFDSVQRGTFDLALGWSTQGPTPYLFYRDLLGTSTLRPLGEAAQGNWHRYGSARADELLAAMEATSDPAAQDALVRALEQVFVDEAPAIPLFPSPAWGACNTRRIEGFPTAEDPWAALSPNRMPAALLVMTELRPRSTP